MGVGDGGKGGARAVEDPCEGEGREQRAGCVRLSKSSDGERNKQ